jgi:hypothetical protein
MADEILTHDKLPRPTGKVVDLDRSTTWDSVSDYILAAYHACVEKLHKARDAEARLWQSAAQAYVGAYMGIVGLKAIPGDGGLVKAKEQVAAANHLADEAAAAGARA